VVEIVFGHQLDGVQVAFVDFHVKPADERPIFFPRHDYFPLLLKLAATDGGPSCALSSLALLA
jgi:hypothetical protein